MWRLCFSSGNLGNILAKTVSQLRLTKRLNNFQSDPFRNTKNVFAYPILLVEFIPYFVLISSTLQHFPELYLIFTLV